MATVSHKEGPFDSSSGYGNTSPQTDAMPGGIMAAMIDCSVQNLASSDVWQAITVPAGSIVVAVGAVILTAEGGTLTIDVGDGDDPDGYLDGSNGNTASASYSSINGTTGYSGGRYYAAEDTIDVLANNAADAAKIVVWCKFFKTNLN
tara:strand:+ start:2235 stop:2678 length:444 start_codon:yes stop_codon:yes gene_type:complete